MYYGPGYNSHNNNHKKNDIKSILEYYKNIYSWEPDAILTYGYRYTVPFTGLGECLIPKIHIICDFTPAIAGWQGTIGPYFSMMVKHQYDLYFAMSYQVMEWFSIHFHGAKIHYLPFGVNEKMFSYKGLPKVREAYIGWSHHDAIYPLRRPIENMIHEEFGDHHSILIKKCYGEAFVAAINSARMALNTSNAFCTMNMKNFEVMACNTLLVTETVQEMLDLGYRPFVHYIDFTDVIDLKSKMETLFRNHQLCDDIALAGYELTLKENTNLRRVERMTRIIHEEL